ncbi:hypothetical protein [Fluviispira sanaruensis]|uniref:HAD family hydrolase n=1 Tax=Fluviispira sanaruensis TaxID=2493639 RepID=A0A4P2VSS6_FLUSA|nr:hypothetical protein [Fluviispira sanaruensis]BBH52365.1 hypothetical protein JCM31447_08060 [Fluviispira sanaruensis]
MIKNIIFDFGGVLLEWDPDNLYLSYFKSNEATEAFYQEPILFWKTASLLET